MCDLVISRKLKVYRIEVSAPPIPPFPNVMLLGNADDCPPCEVCIEHLQETRGLLFPQWYLTILRREYCPEPHLPTAFPLPYLVFPAALPLLPVSLLPPNAHPPDANAIAPSLGFLNVLPNPLSQLV